MKTYCVTLKVKEKEYQSNVEAESLIEAYTKALDEWHEELFEEDLEYLVDIKAEEIVDDEWEWMYAGNIGQEEI